MWLASEYKVQPATIARWIGIPYAEWLTPTQQRKIKEQKRAWRMALCTEARALYAAGATVEELAEKHHVTPRTMAGYLQIDCTPYMSDAQREQRKESTKNRKATWRKELRSAYKMGKGVRAIASEYGLSPVTVAGCLGVSDRPYLTAEQLEHRRESVAARVKRARAKKADDSNS
jgi:hypothetical protein